MTAISRSRPARNLDRRSPYCLQAGKAPGFESGDCHAAAARLAPGVIGNPSPRGANREVRPATSTDGATASSDRRAETPRADVSSLMSMSDQFRDWHGR